MSASSKEQEQEALRLKLSELTAKRDAQLELLEEMKRKADETKVKMKAIKQQLQELNAQSQQQTSMGFADINAVKAALDGKSYVIDAGDYGNKEAARQMGLGDIPALVDSPLGHILVTLTNEGGTDMVNITKMCPSG